VNPQGDHLQSLSGELRRSRYWCRVRADGPVSLIVEEAKLDEDPSPSRGEGRVRVGTV
jgi:hypothetical protein